MTNRTCTIDNCARPHKAKGLCQPHYDRKRKGLDPEGTYRFSDPADALDARSMPVTETGCLIWTGHVDPGGYGRINIDGAVVTTHRYAWERANGEIPKGTMVDHICWVRSCVNVDHLRLVSRSENGQNRSGPTRTSTSKIRGVSWHKQAKKWVAYITVGGKRHYGGLHADKGEAARVAAEMRSRLMTHSQN